jgi:MoaA/NifB/PqqE/SkfB family radical SAM enzyme
MPNVNTWRGLRMIARGYRNLHQKKPLSVSFEVTHSCTANCWHCNLGGQIKEERLPPAGYAEICRELRPVVAHVSGGEPLARNDVFEIVRALAGVPGLPWLVVVSNGSLLTPEKFHRLKEAGMHQLSLSLDFPDERLDEFRRIPGLFHRLDRLVPELANRFERDDILINVCITSWNFRDVPDIVRLAESWGVGVNFSAFSHLRVEDRAGLVSPESKEEFREKMEEVIRLRGEGYPVYNVPRVLWNYFRFLTGEPIPGCTAGERFLVVNPDGRLTPCAHVLAFFDSQEEMYEHFTKQNTCEECYIATRSATEPTVRQFLQDNAWVFSRWFGA